MKKNKIHETQIRVYAKNVYKKPGFNIYINCSGQEELLMYHRHNGLLYRVLKEEKTLGELKRWRVSDSVRTGRRKHTRKKSSSLCNMVGYLIRVINEYLEDVMADSSLSLQEA